jgi:hypothetical protein
MINYLQWSLNQTAMANITLSWGRILRLKYCSAYEQYMVMFVREQISAGECTLNDPMFTGVMNGLNSPALVGNLSKALGVSIPNNNNNQQNLLGLVMKAYLTKANSAAYADYVANCKPQMVFVVSNILINSLGLSEIASSPLYRNVSSVGAGSCTGKAGYVFTFTTSAGSLQLSFKKGSQTGVFNFGPLINQFAAAVMSSGMGGGSSIVAQLGAKVGQCLASYGDYNLINGLIGYLAMTFFGVV